MIPLLLILNESESVSYDFSKSISVTVKFAEPSTMIRFNLYLDVVLGNNNSALVLPKFIASNMFYLKISLFIYSDT